MPLAPCHVEVTVTLQVMGGPGATFHVVTIVELRSVSTILSCIGSDTSTRTSRARLLVACNVQPATVPSPTVPLCST